VYLKNVILKFLEAVMAGKVGAVVAVLTWMAAAGRQLPC
jgi:hypothetical protein